MNGLQTPYCPWSEKVARAEEQRATKKNGDTERGGERDAASYVCRGHLQRTAASAQAILRGQQRGPPGLLGDRTPWFWCTLH